jgi:hypothetical protein
MRSALKEALELFGDDFCYNDGRIINADDPVVGAQWVMQARTALGLDPITGKRIKRTKANTAP